MGHFTITFAKISRKFDYDKQNRSLRLFGYQIGGLLQWHLLLHHLCIPGTQYWFRSHKFLWPELSFLSLGDWSLGTGAKFDNWCKMYEVFMHYNVLKSSRRAPEAVTITFKCEPQTFVISGENLWSENFIVYKFLILLWKILLKRFCLWTFNKIHETQKDCNTDNEIISCNHFFNWTCECV